MITTAAQGALLSILSNLLLIAVKLAVGLWTGSVAILSEALHSGVDLLASVAAWVSIREAAKPADRGHPYGHEKFEPLAGAFEALLVLLAVGYIFYRAGASLISPREVHHLDWGAGVMLFSALMNLGVSRFLYRQAKRFHSVALEGDALHLATDVYTSLGVMAGVILVNVTHRPWLDPLAAIAIAAYLLPIAKKLLRQTLAELLDESLPAAEEDRIRAILGEWRDRIVEFHDLRTRKAGKARHIDLHLVLCREMRVGDSHDLCDRLEERLGEEIPGARILIHVEPCEHGKECLEVCRRLKEAETMVTDPRR